MVRLSGHVIDQNMFASGLKGCGNNHKTVLGRKARGARIDPFDDHNMLGPSETADDEGFSGVCRVVGFKISHPAPDVSTNRALSFFDLAGLTIIGVGCPIKTVLGSGFLSQFLVRVSGCFPFLAGLGELFALAQFSQPGL